MPPLLFLDAAALQSALPMHRAIGAMSEALVLLATGGAEIPARAHLDDGSSTLLVMPGLVPGRAQGAKLVTIRPDNPAQGRPAIQGLVVLLDPGDGRPLAVLDGTFLTAWRTGAVAGLATQLLAREESAVGGVIGAGPQARTQVLAIDAARELESIRVFGRTPARAAALVEALQSETRATLSVAASAEAAVRDADVVCTATPAESPVLEHAWLAPGAHVNAIGSFRPSMRELERETVTGARVFVDRLEDALEEAGELIEAARAEPGLSARWVELGRVAAGAAPGRASSAEHTLFKSVGNAVQDLIAAAQAVEAARALGLGHSVPFDPAACLG